MNDIFIKVLGINWKTTLAGWTAIVAVIGKLGLALRTKDISAVLSSGQELLLDISILLTGIGLLKAKDKNVTGVGVTAKAVDSTGTVVNTAGDVVGKQPITK